MESLVSFFTTYVRPFLDVVVLAFLIYQVYKILLQNNALPAIKGVVVAAALLRRSDRWGTPELSHVRSRMNQGACPQLSPRVVEGCSPRINPSPPPGCPGLTPNRCPWPETAVSRESRGPRHRAARVPGHSEGPGDTPWGVLPTPINHHCPILPSRAQPALHKSEVSPV